MLHYNLLKWFQFLALMEKVLQSPGREGRGSKHLYQASTTIYTHPTQTLNLHLSGQSYVLSTPLIKYNSSLLIPLY